MTIQMKLYEKYVGLLTPEIVTLGFWGKIVRR